MSKQCAMLFQSESIFQQLVTISQNLVLLTECLIIHKITYCLEHFELLHSSLYISSFLYFMYILSSVMLDH